MNQSWNNVLSYIKMNLGVPLNMLELSDDDIIEYLSENTLPEFSNYVPNNKFVLLTDANLIDDRLYKFKIPTDDYIIDVVNVYLSPGTGKSFVSESDIVSSAIENKFIDMFKSLNTTITFKFEQPNYLYFYDDDILTRIPALVEYSTVHSDLSTIPSDMYTLFKKLCLADIKIIVGNMRTKFQLSTPLGQVMNNGETLRQEGMQERQIIIENLKVLPPDKFLEII